MDQRWAIRLRGGMVALLLTSLLLVPARPGWSSQFTLNLQGADLKTLIETVSEATGRNFVLDPAVQGKVTVISSQPMSSDELYEVFLTILGVHGFIAVPSGGAIKIIPDNHGNYNAMPQMLGDVDPSAPSGEVVVRVFPVRHIEALKLVPILRPMVSPKGFVSAIETSNLLIVSDFSPTIGRLAEILRRIDRPATGEVELIPLQHASAREMVRVLQNLDSVTTGGNPADGKPTFAVDERTNSILLGGTANVRLRMRALITHLDTPVDIIGNTQVVHLRFAKAETLVKVLTSIGENFQTEAEGSEGGAASRGIVNVQAYEGANALVITAPPNLLRTMMAVIEKLDRRRAQVKVEAIIAEIETDKAAEFGVQWNSLPLGLDGVSFTSNFTTTDNGIVGLSGTSSGVTNLTGIGDGLSIGLMEGTTSILGANFINLTSLLRVLRGDSSTNILQTPTLVTMDNEPAEIIVAENVPFITGSYTTGASSAANPFQTIEREDVGLILKVIPQINEGDTIRLEIQQELSDVKDTPTLGADGVVTNTRSIKTVVMVDDGQVLVLGGLIRDRQQSTEDRVPILGDIPVLGQLFRYERNTDAKTNLMVFLQPTILRSAQDGLRETRRLYQHIRNEQLSVPTGTGFMSLGETPPLLPEIEQYLSRNQMPGHSGGMDGLSGGPGIQPAPRYDLSGVPVTSGQSMAPVQSGPPAFAAPQSITGLSPSYGDPRQPMTGLPAAGYGARYDPAQPPTINPGYGYGGAAPGQGTLSAPQAPVAMQPPPAGMGRSDQTGLRGQAGQAGQLGEAPQARRVTGFGQPPAPGGGALSSAPPAPTVSVPTVREEALDYAD